MSKKRLLFATLTALGVSAQAQSSLTTYGIVDLRVAKDTGVAEIAVTNGAGSRLGFRGIEDLGGGMRAFFDLQHRFNADTGAQTNAQRFFQQSFVGLEKQGLGRVWLGRDWTPAYLQVQLPADPFGNAGLGSLITISSGGIGTFRNDNAITAQFVTGPVTVTMQVAEGTDPPLSTFEDKPVGATIVYQAGALMLAYGYENPGRAHDVWHQVTAVYAAGPVTARLGFGSGTTSTNQDRKSWTLGATYTAGAHRLHAAYGQLENDTAGVAINKKLALGWNYDFSKRTFVYVGVARDRALTTEKSGYETGIRHNF